MHLPKTKHENMKTWNKTTTHQNCHRVYHQNTYIWYMIFLTFVHHPPDNPGHNFHHHHWRIYWAPKPILVSTLVQVRNDVANVLYAPTPAASSGGYGDQVMAMASSGKGEVTSITFDTFHKHQASLGAFLLLHVIIVTCFCCLNFLKSAHHIWWYSPNCDRHSDLFPCNFYKIDQDSNMFRRSTKKIW